MSAVRYIVLFLIFLNAGGVLVDVTGTDDWLGIDPATGTNPELERAESELGSASQGSGASNDGTLFGFYRDTTQTLDAVLNVINPGKAQLEAAMPYQEVQDFITYSFAGAWAVVGFAALKFLRGVEI